jgi:hypothetical protein
MSPRTAFGQDADSVSVVTDKEKAEIYRRALEIMERISGRKIRAGESAALYAGIYKTETGDTNWWGLAMSIELAKDGFALKGDVLQKVFKGFT